MKKSFLVFVFIISLSFLFSQGQVDFILAKVGRDIILFSDLVKQINQMQNAQMWDENMNEEMVLESMIENKLIIQSGRERGIRVDERRITSAVDSQIDMIRSQFSSDEEYHRELRNAGLLASDLRQYYHDMLTEQFIRDNLIQNEIRRKINLTDADILNFYHTQVDSLPYRDTSYELAMILRIPGPSEETEREALEKINFVRNRLQRGDDFSALASQHSDCPSGQAGGDLGFFTRGMMVREFEEAAFNLSLNQVSSVVKTDFGYHLIKLTDRRGNEIRASHILVMLQESEDDVLRERVFLSELRDRIQRGESFGNIASEFSQDEGSKANEGVLGELTLEEFPPWFLDELIRLRIGEVSTVLEHQNMLYLFIKNKELPPRPFVFEEIKDNLREILSARRQYELYQQMIEGFKNEIYVEIHRERLSVFQ